MSAKTEGGAAAAAAGGQQGVPVDALPVQQLHAIKNQMDEDIRSTIERVELLRQAKGRFQASKTAIEQLEGTEGKEVLVAVSESLYVRGKQGSTDKVLVDVGTGYYIEKNRKDALQFCSRKADMLTTTVAEVDADLEQKKHMANQVGIVLAKKMAAARQAAAPGVVAAPAVAAE